MTEKIAFTKMHGAGNDYIYVNTLLYNIGDPVSASVAWSKPHTGIGSDGLVLICAPTAGTNADFRMRIFNADGSEAMMCGNASRCIGKYIYEKGLTRKTEIRLETLSGVKTLKLHLSEEGTVGSVTVDMLDPRLKDESQFDSSAGMTLKAEDRVFEGTFVSMGNPHFVIFVDDVEHLDVARYGSCLEHNAAFPQRCNIEFVEKLPSGDLRMRVWERGSGITMACGTGSCATAVAACLTGHAERKCRVIMDGGALEIEWNAADNHVYMTGPAAFVFEGIIENAGY